MGLLKKAIENTKGKLPSFQIENVFVLCVNQTQLVKVTDGKQPSEHPGDDSNQDRLRYELPELYDELQRKHVLLLTIWNSLDTKIGLLLGFTVVVLFGLILNVEVINSMAVSTPLTFSLSLSAVSSAIFWLILSSFSPFMYMLVGGIAAINAAAFWLFWFAFGSFLFAFAVGISALHIRTFEDIDTITGIEAFRLADGSITPAQFKRTLGGKLYAALTGYEECVGGKIVKHPGNEKTVRRKGWAVRLVTYGFTAGTVLFLIRFVILVI